MSETSTRHYPNAPITEAVLDLRIFPRFSYFMQLSIPLQQIEGRAVITETVIPPAKPGHVSMILDIDVAKEFPLPATDQQAWSILDEIHDLKNEIFEACVTDKARELFK